MNLLAPDPDPGDPRRVLLEARRTCERLRTLSLARLAAPLPDGGTRAGAARVLAQEAVDRTAAITGEPPRRLPPLPDSSAGDVLAVCFADLVEALPAGRGGPVDPRLGAACAWATERLIALRSVL